MLYQSNLVTPRDFTIFISEASVAAILDSGASSSVAGKKWLDSYLQGLSDNSMKKVAYQKSNTRFKFGSGTVFESLYKVKIPARIGGKNVSIESDIVETDVPLLLSKDAMKRAETEINFVTDTVRMFGQEQDVFITSSGHYAVPLNNSGEVMMQVENRKEVKVNLVVEGISQNNDKIALKLHAQFGHPPKARLVNLLRRAGKGENKELLKSLEKVEKQCNICQKYSRPSPRPVVGFPHASAFNETLAMDLFFYEGKIVLHLIDHLTRFSAGRICKSKQPGEIIKAIFDCWISIFGAPGKILSDNGREFANEEMLEMA